MTGRRQGCTGSGKGRTRALVARAAYPIVALALSMPGTVSAQAFCSAPHSSPTLTQSGAIRTLPAGSGWAQLSLLGQRSHESFNPNGDRQPYLADARYDVGSVFLTAATGVVEGFELWLQAPVHNLSVDGDGGSSQTFGLGDIRGAIRLSPALVEYEVPVALRGGIKLPGSEFPVDATELPLSEGQIDFELSVESGWSSATSPYYVVGWVGYRWRLENADVGYHPGDETFVHAALGGVGDTFNWELGFDGLWGGAPIESGLMLPSAARRLLQILPTVGARVGSGQLELTTPIPVAGRNLPAGFAVSLGYRTTWGF